MKRTIRKTLFTLIILALLILGIKFSKEDLEIDYKIKSGNDMSFFVATDTHYLSKSLTDDGSAFQKYVSAGDGKQLKYIDEMMDTFSYEIKNKKPEVLIISGDLTNNGEKLSHLELADKLKVIESYGTSVYVIPGNHDILNPWARGFKEDDQYITENISAEDFSNIYSEFGYNEAVLRDKDTLSYLATPSEDVWILMLDTSLYKSNSERSSPQGDGEISDDTFKWIKKCSSLAKSKGAKIITVMHHNLIDHNEVLNDGYTLNNSKKAINEFEKLDLNIVLSGHIHLQDIKSTNNEENKIYDIATSALSVYPNQYGVIELAGESLSFDYSTVRLDVENWAKDNAIEEKYLLEFKKNSEEFFGQSAYQKAFDKLLMEDIYTKEEVMEMAEIFKNLNLKTFSGTEHLGLSNIINSKGYKLWLESPDSFYKRYILSMGTNKDNIDDNNLKINLNK